MIEEAPDAPVEFRVQAAPPGFTVWSGDLRVAGVAAREDRRAFAVNIFADGHCGRDLADRILADVETMAAGPGAVIDSQGAVLRDEARRRGYGGPLRGRLTIPSPPDGSAGPGADGAVAAAVAVLAGRPLTVDPGSAPRRLLNAVRFGYGRALRLVLAEPALTVTIPDSPDVMIESVARAIDTVLAVRARFGASADHLRAVSFDRVSHRPEGAKWAGQADHLVFSIHLSDNLVLADEWVRYRRALEAKGNRSGSAGVPHPFSRVDGVSAHEAWHQIEYKFRARTADHSAFRRELGAALGVETLEQAIQGRQRNAPEELRAAAIHLARTVSPYATKNPLEATAEMFKLWWCGVSNPTVDRFGQLLDRFFGIGATR